MPKWEQFLEEEGVSFQKFDKTARTGRYLIKKSLDRVFQKEEERERQDERRSRREQKSS